MGLNYTVGNKVYRYGYQGQFAEKDAETGFESFELRLYNDRIGRWTSSDPEGQFSSPYVGMGNNPVSGVDPNGGFAEGVIGQIWKSGMMAAGGFVTGAGIGIISGDKDPMRYALIGASIGLGASLIGSEIFDSSASKLILEDVGQASVKGLTFKRTGIDKDPFVGYRTVGYDLKISGNKPGTHWFQTAISDEPDTFGGRNKPNEIFIDNGGSKTSPYFDPRQDYHDNPQNSYGPNIPSRGRYFRMELSQVKLKPNGKYKILRTVSTGYYHYLGQKVVTIEPLKFSAPSQAHIDKLNSFKAK